MLGVSVAQLQLAVAQGLNLGPVTVLDSTPAILSNLGFLLTWRDHGVVLAVQSTDPAPLEISFSHETLQIDPSLLDFFQGNHTISAFGDSAFDLLAQPKLTYLGIADSSANVPAKLDALVDASGRIALLAVVDGLVALTYDEFRAEHAILQQLFGPSRSIYPDAFRGSQALPFAHAIVPTYTITSDLTFAQAINVIFTDNHAASLHIVDSAAHLDWGLLDAASYRTKGGTTLIPINGGFTADFGHIQFTDDVVPTIHVPTDFQFFDGGGLEAVLASIDSPFDLVIDRATAEQVTYVYRSPLLGYGRTSQFNVVDTAAHIMAKLDGLTQLAIDNHLASITVTDVPPSSLSFTPAQWAANAAAIAKISPSSPPTGAVTVNLQDNAIGSVDAPYHYVPGLGFAINGHAYVVTPLSYSSASEIVNSQLLVWTTQLTNIFGPNARLADWQELKLDLRSPELVQAFLSGIGLPVETPYGTYPNLLVAKDGSWIQTGPNHYNYFITNFTGSTPAAVGYGALDSIGPLVIGAYSWPGQALVRIDGNVAGATTPGHVLSVSNSLADPDGMGAVSYQWLANGAVIDGATGLTLTLGQELIGKVITVVARYVDGLGTPESVTSAGVLVTGQSTSRPGLDPTIGIALANDTGPSGIDSVTRDPALGGWPNGYNAITFKEGGQVIAVASSSSWTTALGGLADGVHVITAEQIDPDGRLASGQLTFTLDRTPPAAPVLHVPARTSDGLVTVAGTAEAGGSVTLYQDGVLLGTTSTDSAGQFSFDLTMALGAGRHLFTATASDLAGNVSALSGAASTFTGAGASPGNAYLFVAAPHITFDGALSQAATHTLDGVAGHLLTVESAAEQAALMTWLGAASGDTAVWLGMTDSAVEGVWRYAAGPQTGALVDFTAWTPGEPNNWQGNEDQATFKSVGWNDYDGTDPYGTIRGFVVEFENATGSAGDEFFVGAPGDNRIDGGGGHDTLLVGDSSRHFTIAASADSVTITDKVGANGIDTLHGIETLRFADQAVDTAWFTAAASLPQFQFVPLIEMYIAYFNRAPDAVGLDYWAAQLAGGMSLPQIAASFFVQPETAAQYPAGQPIETFIDAVYHNVLGRAPDASGKAYWIDQLAHGLSQPTFLLAIINGAHASTGSAGDAQYLANKELVGTHFALAAGLSNVDQARTVMSTFDGSAASVTAANQLTDTYHAAALTSAGSDLVVQLVGLAA